MEDIMPILTYAYRNNEILKEHDILVFRDEVNQANNLVFDWDIGCEEWFTISYGHQEFTTIAFVCIKLRIAFVKEGYLSYLISYNFFNRVFVYVTSDFNKNKWKIDLVKLKDLCEDLNWHTISEAVNENMFSINGFYYATI